MISAAQLAALGATAQAAMEECFPATIRLGDDATEYAAAVSGLNLSDPKLSIEGLLVEQGAGFRVRKALLPLMPEVGGRLWWKERDRWLRIVRVADRGGHDPAWFLGCQAINR